MEKLERALILVPIIVAFIQWLKQILSDKMKNYLWIITCIVWIVAAYWYVGALWITDMNNTMIIFGWIIAWLSASWLYEAGKNAVSAIKSSNQTDAL